MWPRTTGQEMGPQSLTPHGVLTISTLSLPLLPLRAEPSEHMSRFW